MRAPRILVVASLGAVVNCSLITSFDGIGPGGGRATGGGGTATSTASGGHAATGGGSDGDAGGGGSGGSPDDGGADAEGCTPGGLYCGDDGVHGDAGWLYVCRADGGTGLVEMCARSCSSQQPAHDDLCTCLAGGLYCGGDDLLGDPDSLYTCKQTGGVEGTLVKHCTYGCRIVPGDDDACNPAP